MNIIKSTHSSLRFHNLESEMSTLQYLQGP